MVLRSSTWVLAAMQRGTAHPYTFPPARLSKPQGKCLSVNRALGTKVVKMSSWGPGCQHLTLLSPGCHQASPRNS